MRNIKRHNYNKFDVYIFLLIISLLGGQYGGVLQLSRIVAIALFPAFVNKMNLHNKVRTIVRPFVIFFVLWYLYNLISLSWTPDINEGMKEAFYYIVHPLLFMELLLFSFYSKDAVKTISTAWILAIIITLPVAIWEIRTNIHLSTSTIHDELYTMEYGVRHLHRNASFTFGNYNNYNVFICLCLPFCLCGISHNDKKITRLILVATILAVLYVVLINASRGAVVVSLIVLGVYTIHSFSSNYKLPFIFLIGCIIFAVIKYGDVLFEMINIRTGGGDELLKDDSRTELIQRGFLILYNTYGLGCGMGGIISAMMNASSYGSLTHSPHNLFVELFAQYGLLIGICVVLFIFKIVKYSFKVRNNSIKILLWSAIFSLPFMVVINSGYLLFPHVWAYFACLYVVAYKTYCEERIQKYNEFSSAM